MNAQPVSTQRRLRIALVVHEYNRWMGHSRYVAELASRFKRDHEIHVFANSFEEPDPTGITFHRIPIWKPNALASIVSFILPATVLVRGPFDIVHSQGLCGLRQNVVTTHICQPAWYAAADRHAPQSGWRKRVFRAVILGLDKLVMRRGAAARFIAPSDRVRDDIAANYRLGDKVRVVYHGTDTETFHPRNRDKWRQKVRSELGLNPVELVALYVGDLQKAMPAAIRALARTTGVKLLAVSRSDPGPYTALAAVEGVTDRVRFLPPSREPARFYAAADLFLFPTYYDTFGLVLTEAMATGIPAVASRAAGAAELIQHGENGWLTPEPWDPEQIAEGVRALTIDPIRREAMGLAARATVERYTWDRTAAETLAIYREIVTERR